MTIFVRLLFLISFFGLQAQVRKPFESSVWMTAGDKPSKGISSEKEVKYFNFNPPISFEKQEQYLKNKINFSKSYTLFLVYKDSTNLSNLSLLEIKRGDVKIEVKSDKIFANNQIDLSKGSPSNGFMLTAFNTNLQMNKSKDCAISFNERFGNPEFPAKVYEMIYFPKVLNKLERIKIESYLSLKYGISMINRDYYNSKGEKIWNLKTNSGYLANVTAISRDDSYALYQKQSNNFLNYGMTIGVNSIAQSNHQNSSEINNLDYFIWSDNNKSLTFNKNESSKGFEVFNRVWKVNQKMIRSNRFQLSFDKKKIISLQEDTLPYWLVQFNNDSDMNFSKAILVSPKVNTKEQLVFENVEFSNSSSYFTIIRAPEFFANLSVANSFCDTQGKSVIQLDMVGGDGLYKINIIGKEFNKEIQSEEKSLTIEGLPNGEYNVIITSGKHEYKNQFSIDSFSDNEVALEKVYLLDEDKYLEITPKIATIEDIVAYQWFFESNANAIGTESTLKVNQPGKYKLVIQNKKGCTKESDFEVKSTVKIVTGWSIYPNPAEAGQIFKIQFNFNDKKSVSLRIHDLNGKLIKNIVLGTIENYNYVDFLSKSGTYLVTVEIDGKESAHKLIIK